MAIAGGGVVAVIAPDGTPGTVPEDQLQDALKMGYKLEGAAEHRERRLEKEYGDSPIAAAGLGALSSATLGGSDFVLAGLADAGGNPDNAIREISGRNKDARTLGELGGMLTGIGAAGLASKAGARAGEKVAGTAVIEGLLGGGTAARAVGGGVKMGVAAGTEGALQGVGRTVSEVALSEDPMSAEAIAARLGSNVLYGGGAGAAVGAGLGSLGSLVKSAGARAKGMGDRAMAAAEEAAAAPPPARGVPDDIATLDRAGLKAAHKAETEALAAGQKADRVAINEEFVGYREQVRTALQDVPSLLAKTGTAQKGLARELIQAERGLANVIDTIPEAPQRGLSALRKLDRQLGAVRGALPEELAGQFDDLLARNKDLATRLEGSMAAPASERLTAIAGRMDELANPSLASAVAGHAKDQMWNMASGAAIGMLGPIGFLAPLARAGFDAFRKRLGGEASRFAQELSEGVAAVASGATAAAPALARTVATAASFGAMGARRSDDELEQRAHDVLDAVANLDATRLQVHESLTGIRAVDGKLADQMEEQAMRRLDYLAKVAPKNPGVGALGQERFRPSDAEMARFSRCVAATEQPLRILDEIKADRLTPQTVEAVKTVYPELFKRLGVELMDQMVKPGGKPLTLARHLGLTMILGTPTDSRMRPEFIGRQQQAWAQHRADVEKQAQQPAPQPPSQSRDARALTDSQPTAAQQPML